MKRTFSQAVPAGSQGVVKKRKWTRSLKKKKRIDPVSTAYGLGKFSGEGPFPLKLSTSLVYRSVPTVITGSAGTGTALCRVRLNDPNDFDYDNLLGNKQPLFYDQLFTATGPYTAYEVRAWTTRISIINLANTAVTVYWNGKGSTVSFTEEDTLSEMTNRQFVSQYHLAPKGGTGDRCYIRSNGNMSAFNRDDAVFTVGYGTSPAIQAIGSLFFNTPTTTDAPSVMVQVDHYFHMVCSRVDAAASA